MKTSWIGLPSIALTCALTFAQTPPAPPTPEQHVTRQLSMLTERLSLTADQQKQISGILTGAATTEAKLRTGMEAAHKSLQTAIQSNDSAAIATAAEQIGDLTRQEVQARATADAAIYALLTPDQQAKFKNFGPRGHHGHGFGPPGPPPPDGE